MTKLYSFFGHKGAGKDLSGTFFEALLKQDSKKYVHLSFATPLKKMIHDLFDITEDESSPQNKETKLSHYPYYSPRELYQYIGTDLFRDHFDPMIWVRLMREKIIKVPKDTDIIITDMRFPNEEQLLREVFREIYIPIKVERYLKDNEYSDHISESYIDEFKFKYLIRNDTSIPDLAIKISDLYKVINNE